ncbi:MAG: hypothetical protein ACX939_13625 [Hyphococcus sp.]
MSFALSLALDWALKWRAFDMSTKAFLGVAVGVLLLSACATNYAETAANNEVEADEASSENVERRASINFNNAAEGEDRIICKRTIQTGTRFSKKECRSWREWREMMEATQDIMREGQMRNLQTDVPAGN